MIVQMNKNTLKYVSLLTLTVQNALLGLSMRYGRTRPGDLFLSTTAVLMAEAVKLLTCLVLVFYENGKDASKFVESLHTTVIKNYIDTVKICVPSLLYVVQNNLLYISASHLDAATYQVSYQLKILTTAVFAVIILRKRLLPTQWAALVILVAGIALVQTADSTKATVVDPNAPPQNRLLGFAAALGACVLSGFAGIYFEKMLKGADISVWMRNVQLSLLSLPFGVITCMISDFATIRDKGFFVGYDLFVWYLVVLQAGGGLIVAMVVKYADNILKGFATSLAIVISCVASIYLFSFNLTLQFTFGAALVIASVFLYGHVPKSNAQTVRPVAPNSEDEAAGEKEKEKFLRKI